MHPKVSKKGFKKCIELFLKDNCGLGKTCHVSFTKVLGHVTKFSFETLKFSIAVKHHQKSPSFCLLWEAQRQSATVLLRTNAVSGRREEWAQPPFLQLPVVLSVVCRPWFLTVLSDYDYTMMMQLASPQLLPPRPQHKNWAKCVAWVSSLEAPMRPSWSPGSSIPNPW